MVDGSPERVIGCIEVSVLPTTGSTAPILPLPRWIKSLAFQPLQPYISNLLVDRRYRRRGYAKRLVQACEDTARAWGFDSVFLHVDADYLPAVLLYESLGYSIVREDPEWKKSLFGTRLRYMTKSLL